MEIYSGEIKKVYEANGVPLFLEFIIHFLSAFIHLFIMSTIIFFLAPLIFDTTIPSNLPVYLISLAIFIATTLSIGSVFGLVMKDVSKLTMISQLVFMPSLMLSGIMFPAEMLPKVLEYADKTFPATWAFKAMTNNVFELSLYIPMIVVFIISIIICAFILRTDKFN